MKATVCIVKGGIMRIQTVMYGIAVVLIASNCGVPQSDYDNLRAENKILKSELDECRFGAERLIAAIEKAYIEKNYSLARQSIALLYSRHPESPKNTEFDDLLKTIEKEEMEAKKQMEAEERERIRLANLNNTGMWSIFNYVDEWGEPTENRYITNTRPIRGTFSNIATQDSELDVRIVISNSSSISIVLYEYAGNNPIKTNIPETYAVLFQDKDGDSPTLWGTNSSDKLEFGKTESREIHNALMKGGTVKFRIIQWEVRTNQASDSRYSFTIRNANGYENAYTKLKEY